MKRVWVNGCFDIVHVGHIKLLEYAASFGSVRVGLDSDERIYEHKGPKRPYNRLIDRMYFLSNVKFVNDVVVFESDEELVNLIKEYKPDIMVIGDEYRNKDIIGAEYCGGIIYFPKYESKSTTEIISKL